MKENKARYSLLRKRYDSLQEEKKVSLVLRLRIICPDGTNFLENIFFIVNGDVTKAKHRSNKFLKDLFEFYRKWRLHYKKKFF